MDFAAAFDRLLGHEGGYVDHPDDPGGKTRFGITEAVARAEGYQGAMHELPVELARQIYRSRYWDAVRADQLPEVVRFDLFDAAVNSGPRQAAQWLQRAAGTDPDGIVGPITIAAVEADPEGVRRRFNGLRLRFMTDLSTWSSFGRGWARRIADNLLQG